MSKKFLSLAIWLGSAAALAGAGIAVANALPSAVVTSISGTPTSPTATVPANNEQISQVIGVSQIVFEYPGDGSETGEITIDRNSAPAVVKKDGVEIFSVPAAQWSYPKGYPNKLLVPFPQTLKEPGKYSVTLPAGAANHVKGSDAYAAQCTVNFTIYAAIDYTVSPAQNTEVMAGTLSTITITYTPGTTITLNPAAQDTELWFYNSAAEWPEEGEPVFDTFISGCSVSAAGNVVTISVLDPSGITSTTRDISSQFYYCKIPAGAWTATNGSLTETVKAQRLQPWKVVSFLSSDIKLVPANGDEVVAGKDLREIQLQFPSPVLTKKTPGATVGYLYMTGTDNAKAQGFMFAMYKFKELSEDGKTMTLYTDRTSARYAYNFDVIESNWYRFQMLASIFFHPENEKALNPIMYWDCWKVEGAVGQIANTVTPQNASNLVVPASKGFQKITLAYAAKVAHTPGFTGVMTLKKDGVAIKEIAPSEITLAAAGANSVTVPLSNDMYKIPGTYTLEIPEGFFTQCQYGTNPTAADVITWSIAPDAIDMTFAPEGYTTSALAKAGDNYDYIRELVIEYPEGYTLSNPAQKFANTTIWWSKGTAYVYPESVVAQGNKLIVTMPEPDPSVQFSTFDMSPNPWMFNIAANQFTITDPDGNSFGNTKIGRYYRMGEMLQGTCSIEDKIYPNATDALTDISYGSFQSLYPPFDEDAPKYFPENAVLYRKGDRSTPLVEFQGHAIEGNSFKAVYNPLPETVIMGMEVEELYALLEGDFEFVIPEGGLQGGATSPTSTLVIFNSEDFVYPFSVAPILPGRFSQVAPEAVAMPYECPSGNGLNYVIAGLDYDDLPAAIAQNPNSTGDLQLLYSADGSDYKVVKAVPALENMYAMGWGSPLNVNIIFDEAAGEDVPEIYNTPGYYRIQFPDGAFALVVGEELWPLQGASIDYQLNENTDPDMQYTLDPVPAEYRDATDASALAEISITFPNAKQVSYTDPGSAYGPALKITTPAKEVIYSGVYPEISDDRKTITYSFPEPENGWELGWYLMQVPAYAIEVNVNEFTWDYEKGNFPGFMTVYGFGESEVSRIDIIGGEAAESYNIVTLNGQVLKLNGSVEDLAGLEPGVYVVNGRKVIIRK